MVRLSTNYIKLQILAIVCLVLVVITFNYIINPYDIYNGPVLKGVNAVKLEREKRLRMFKTTAVEAVRPTGLILGSSRANRALDPRHPGWSVKAVYNLSVPAGNIRETRRLFEHAHNVRPLEQVVFAVDFFMFNAMRRNPATFQNGRLRGAPNMEHASARMKEAVATLFSFDALTDSVATLRRQDDPCGRNKFLYLTRADGFRTMRHCARYDQHMVITHGLSGFVRGDGEIFYRPYSFENSARSLNAFEEFETILRIANRDGMDLRIVILPVHAWQLEMLWAEGLWPRYERWKRELLESVTRIAEDRTRVPVWDFTAYNSLTTEEVPPAGQTDVKLRWFVDASHMTPEYGKRVLDIVLGTGDLDEFDQKGQLGLLLTAQNIDGRLARIRKARDAYAQLNEAWLQEVYRLIQ